MGQTLMTSTPVLAAPDFSKTFILEYHALGTGVGAVLMQDKNPITFKSQKLKPRELNKVNLRQGYVGNNACPG